MLERFDDDADTLSEETFMKSWNSLKNNRKDKYKFLFRAGGLVRRVCLEICQQIWETEIYPEDWNLSTLVQLDKGKSDISDLDGKRNIHLRDEVSKLFAQIVITSSKDEMIKNMSKFQIGSRSGHKPAEHIFVITSYLALSEKRKKFVIINMID